jgi:copper(I)-binding protein
MEPLMLPLTARRSRHPYPARPQLAASVGLLVTLLLIACGAPAGPKIAVEGVWARPVMTMAASPEGRATPTGGAMATPATGMAGPTSAVFMVIRNEGRDPDRLVAAATEVAQVVELHQTKMEGGVMRMNQVPAIEVPAGGRVELKPGDYHVMLIGVRRELKLGDRFPVRLQFEKSGSLTVEAEVRQS